MFLIGCAGQRRHINLMLAFWDKIPKPIEKTFVQQPRLAI